MSEEIVIEGVNKKSLRLSHPNLYRTIMVFAFISIGLGLNFIFTNPTFNPYNIPKEITGTIFLILGIGKLIFLIAVFNLKMVRVVMSLEIAFMIFWGIGTSITFFQGKTSLQLFVLYVGLSLLELFLLIEPSVNPVSQVKEKNEL